MDTIKIISGRLEGLVATNVNRDYVGSITIDSELLNRVGMLPLEEVTIANLLDGKRLSTYVLPDESGERIVCPNGGCYFMCKKGDRLTVFNYRTRQRQASVEDYTARLAKIDSDNRIEDLVQFSTAQPFGNESVRLMRGKLHQIRVTAVDTNAPTSVVVDPDLLERAGILPFEEAQLANLEGGERMLVPTVHGKHGSREVRLCGAAAFSGRVNDRILLFSFGAVPVASLHKRPHVAKVVICAAGNEVKDQFEQTIRIGANQAYEFRTPPIQVK